jgi:hypothetical protein
MKIKLLGTTSTSHKINRVLEIKQLIDIGAICQCKLPS